MVKVNDLLKTIVQGKARCFFIRMRCPNPIGYPCPSDRCYLGGDPLTACIALLKRTHDSAAGR
jgi:hypothetical protein